VASEKNQGLVQRCGADAVFSYNDSKWVKDAISALGSESKAMVIDVISNEETNAACASIASACGSSKIAATIPPKKSEIDGIKVAPVNLGSAYDESEVRSLLERFIITCNDLLARGLLRPNSANIIGMLDQIPRGFKMLAEGKVSGEKLVVRIDEPIAMKAVVADEKGASLKVIDKRMRPLITGPEDVIVRVRSAALNPVDWKMLDFGFAVRRWPHCLGCDMAGTIHALGQDASPSLKKGSRVWAYTSVGEPFSGTFAEFVKVPYSLLGTVPEEMDMDSASSIGLGFVTAGALFWKAEAEDSDCEDCVTLVYGASSSIGQYAVQIAKRYGHKVVAVASRKNKDLCTSLGADEFGDYKAPSWKEDVKKAMAGFSKIVGIDTIGTEKTSSTCAEIVQSQGGNCVATVAAGSDREEQGVSIKSIRIADAYHIPEKRVVLERYVRLAEELLSEGKLKPNKVRNIGGLESVADGLNDLRNGKVSGEKLVITIPPAS